MTEEVKDLLNEYEIRRNKNYDLDPYGFYLHVKKIVERRQVHKPGEIQGKIAEIMNDRIERLKI